MNQLISDMASSFPSINVSANRARRRCGKMVKPVFRFVGVSVL